MKFRGYDIFISDKPDKKYYALVPSPRGYKKVYFGATGYEQYWDVLGHYSSSNHYDRRRRHNYYVRHASDVGNPGTAGWFAANVLWPLDH